MHDRTAVLLGSINCLTDALKDLTLGHATPMIASHAKVYNGPLSAIFLDQNPTADTHASLEAISTI